MDLSFVPAAPGAAFGAMPAGGYPAAGRGAAGAHAGFAHDRGGMFSPPECGVSPPSNAAAAQPSQRRRTEPPLTLRIEVPSGSPFRVPATPTPSPSPPAAAAAAAAPAPDLRMLADLFPAVALRIMKCLDDHALVALSLASTRLNDITEIAAKRKTVEYLSLKTGKGLVVDEAFRGYSERSRWKRMAHCASAVRHFSGLACITSPIEPGDVLAYLHQFPQPSLQSAHRHTNQAVDDAIDRELGANALLRRGVVRFMNGFIVGALYDFLMARENHLCKPPAPARDLGTCFECNGVRKCLSWLTRMCCGQSPTARASRGKDACPAARTPTPRPRASCSSPTPSRRRPSSPREGSSRPTTRASARSGRWRGCAR